jgi:predicted phosphoribosyltransferase
MRVAVEAVRRAGPSAILVAVPTGHAASLEEMAAEVQVYCPNLRGGLRFAVADAYQRWTDLSDDDVARLLSPA